MTVCALCGEPVGDEAYAAYREDARFLPDVDLIAFTEPPLVNYEVHERCRLEWTVPDGYSLTWALPSVPDRERQCHVEARRQAWSLRRGGDGWEITDLAPEGNLMGQMLSGGRVRLRGGRVVPQAMTLAQVEDFLGIDYSVG